MVPHKRSGISIDRCRILSSLAVYGALLLRWKSASPGVPSRLQVSQLALTRTSPRLSRRPLFAAPLHLSVSVSCHRASAMYLRPPPPQSYTPSTVRQALFELLFARRAKAAASRQSGYGGCGTCGSVVVATTQGTGQARVELDGEHRGDGSTCAFWCAVAMGALVQGEPPERVSLTATSVVGPFV